MHDQSDVKLNKIEEDDEDQSPFAMFQKKVENSNLLPDELAQMRAVIDQNFEG